MTLTIRNLLCSIVVVFHCAICVGLVGSAGSNERLVGGSQAKAKDFPSVFIWSFESESITEEYCTGSKVGDEWILTAAHCALGSSDTGYGPWKHLPDMKPGKRIRMSFSRRLSETPRQFFLTLKGVHYPPALEKCLQTQVDDGSVCMKGRVPEPDVVLLHVAPESTPFSRAPSLPIDIQPLQDDDRILLLGYGAEGDSDEWHPPRLKFNQAIVASESEMVKSLVGTMAEIDGPPNWERFFGSVGPLFVSGAPCLGSGDSGGPVLKAKPWRIVGINSDGYCPKWKPICEVATNSVFARVDNQDNNHVGNWILQSLSATIR